MCPVFTLKLSDGHFFRSDGMEWFLRDTIGINGFAIIKPSPLNVFDQLTIVHTSVSGRPLEQYDELLI